MDAPFKIKMNKDFLEENCRKSRMKPMGKRSNECVSIYSPKTRRKSFAVGRLARALLLDDQRWSSSIVERPPVGEVLLRCNSLSGQF